MATVSGVATRAQVGGEAQGSQSATKPKGRFWKYTFIGALSIILAGGLAQLAWTYSGSNRWEALPEKNGVKVYYLKAPGTSLVQYKAVAVFKSSLRQIISFMRDVDVCEDEGCFDPRQIETVDARHEYQAFTYGFPFPFKPRQYVIMDQVSQNPKDNSVLIEYLGVPYKIPPEACCVRVPRMNNKWKFTPRADGSVEVEFVIDNYEGGLMPAFFSNYIGRMSAYGAPSDLGTIINSEKYVKKYQNVSLDFIKEGVPAQ